MKILVFQHVAIEHPGSFRDTIKAQGHSLHQIELDEGEAIPPLHDYDVLLVMGGPMDVWEEEAHPWLAAEKAAIRAWVSAGKPYLGMCFGAQLLAEAMGGKVGLMKTAPEVGMSQVRQVGAAALFSGLPEQLTCFQWHGAEVCELPPGASLIATNAACRVQGFALGEHAYGLQFHAELTETTAQEWAALPEYAAALETVKGPGSLPLILAEVDAKIDDLQGVARRLILNFLQGATLQVSA
ncbi:amidotransferase [Acidocella aquatica]|uniref:Amidotransferase n=1 Tax=Acidocella aquatica TaxID=1922313 RepID=A0ABQ6AC51_9PROT|nr:type 1 glutamine amidotransferase [Acidocella aquatica]GLR68182.1 amidotransferase [Acidocella aquatica]